MNQIFYPEKDVELILQGRTSFQGTLLLADISGFTAITDALCREGKEGVEELTSLLNACFNTMLNEIFHQGGSVITFSGDSILARFTDGARASECAESLIESMRIYRRTVIFGRRYSIGIKVVAGSGGWNQYIIGDREQAHLLLSGDLIGEISSREEKAARGEMVLFSGSVNSPGTDYEPPETKPESFISKGSSRIHGEYRPVTPVFIRISRRGGGRLSPGEFQELYLRIRRIVAKRGGFMHHLDEFVENGSRIFALFGAPVSSGDDVYNAVAAAVETVDTVGTSGSVELCCGVDTGFVYSGAVGNSTRKHYTVIGDPVNTAARLAESGEPGTVTVTEEAAGATASRIQYANGRPLDIRGKTGQTVVCSALGLLETSCGTMEPVGREAETERLIKDSEAGGTTLIAGAAGVGKTTLLTGLERRLIQRGSDVWRTGCSYRGDALEIFSNLLRAMCGIGPDQSASESLSALDEQLASRGLPHLNRRRVFLGRMLLGLDIEDGTFQRLPPKLRSENMLDAMTMLVGSLPPGSCILVEDLHFAVEEARDLLFQLIRTVSRDSPGSISFILTSRPEGLEGIQDRCPMEILNLEGLNREAAEKLILTCTAGAELDGEIEEILFARSQGNPFYLTQLFQYLKEKELIKLSEGVWIKSGSGSLEGLPESVFSMIMARMDRLCENTRESLKVASVVGMRFTEPVLNSIVNRNVHPDMSESLRAGLTFVNSYAELEHIFSHMLIRDVAYSSILSQRRRDLHREIGEILESTPGMTDGRATAVLAYHFIRGEEWKKAAEYSFTAGRHAAEEFRNTEALEHFGNAISLTEKHFPDDRKLLAEYYFRNAVLQDRIGDYTDSRESYRKVVAISPDMGLTASALMGIADILFNTGSMDEGLKIMEEVEKLLPSTGDSAKELELKICAFRAWTHCITGDIEAGEKDALRAVELGRQLEGLPPEERAARLGHALNTLATVYWADSRFDSSRELYEQAVELAVENGLKREAAVTWGNIGLVLEKQGRYLEAVEGISKQLRMASEIGEKLLILSAYGSLGMIQAVLGDFRNSRKNTMKQLELSEALHVSHDHMLALNHLAKIEVVSGNLDRAEELAERGLKLSREHSMDRVMAHSMSILGEIALERKQLSSAMEWFDQGLELARQVGSHSLMLEIMLKIAAVRIDSGELEKAGILLAEAEELASRSGMRLGSADCLRTKSCLLSASGEAARAEDACREAIALYRELGADYNLAEALELLGELLSGGEGQEAARESAGMFQAMGLPRGSS